MLQHSFYNGWYLSSVDFVSRFYEMGKNITQQEKHSIRQMILSKDSIKSLKAIAVEDRDAFTNYQIQSGLDAVVMKNCRRYHATHVNNLCEQFMRNKKFVCNVCKIQTNNIKECFVDAFALSYISSINRKGKTEIYFNIKQLGKQKKEQYLNRIIIQQQQTLTIIGNTLIQTFIINVNNNTTVNAMQIASQIMRLQANQKGRQYIQNISNKCQVNLFCFYQKKRIGIPIMHSKCEIDEHNNKVCLYSLQNVLSTIKNGQKLNCIYPGCPNYFDKDNFFDVALISSDFRRSFYSQKKYLLCGQFNNNIYNKDSQQNQIKNQLCSLFNLRFPHNQHQYKLIVGLCTNVIRNTSVISKKRNPQSIYDKYKADFTQNQTQRYHKATVNGTIFSGSPVRCYKCQNIIFKDLWFAAAEFVMKYIQQCQKCGLKTDNFLYQLVCLDIRLLKLIFLQGKPKDKVIYDCKTDSYVHSVTSFKAEQLSKKLIKQNRLAPKLSKNQYGLIDKKLDRTKQYKAFIHEKCSFQQDSYKNYIFIQNKETPKAELNEKTKQLNFHCPKCKDQLQLPQLLYDEELSNLMKDKRNMFKDISNNIKPVIKRPEQQRLIRNIKQYSQLEDNSRPIKFVSDWVYLNVCSYYNKFITQPIIFQRCNHPPQTLLCDFKDIITDIDFYQQPGEKQYFKCRYSKCGQVYKYTSEVFMVSNIKLQFDKKDKLKIIDSQYWIKYFHKAQKYQFITLKQVYQLNKDRKLYRNQQSQGSIDVMKLKKQFEVFYNYLSYLKNQIYQLQQQDTTKSNYIYQKIKQSGIKFIQNIQK